MMNNGENLDDATQRSSRWLDTDDGWQGAADSDNLSTEDLTMIADLQVVDALLLNLPESANDQRAARIQNVMKAIDATESPLKPTKPRHTLRSAMALAASVLIILGLAWTQFSGEIRAELILREIRKVTLENIDRVYDLRRITSHSAADHEVEAKLYLRGQDGFVLHCDDAVLGRIGDQFWLVPKQGDVLIADSFQWMVARSERSIRELELLKQLSSDSRRVPIMQLSDVVELMKDAYSVTLSTDARTDRNEHAIVGTLTKTSVNLPNQINLWADATSNIIRRAEIRWQRGDTLSLELRPAEQVPAGWYTHNAHHDDRRGVRHVAQ